MTRLTIAVALAIVGMTFTAKAQMSEPGNDTGEFLYQSCSLRLKAIDEPTFKPSPREATHALMCDAYIQGFTDGMIGSSHDYCVAQITREQVIRKYVSFVTENPYFRKEDKLLGIAMVLHSIYRCSKTD